MNFASSNAELNIENSFVSVKDYGAKGDGVIDDTGAINAAINAFNGGQGTIYFPTGTYRVCENITFPHNIDVQFPRGASLLICADRKVAFDGQITAGSYQIFAGDGMKPVEKYSREWFSGVTCNQKIDITWFGAKGDDNTDCTNAIKSAMFSLTASTDKLRKGGTIYFPRGIYRHGDLDFGSPMYDHLIYWEGDGSGSSYYAGGINSSATILRYTGKEEALWLRKINIRKITFYTTTGKTGLQLGPFNTDCKLEDITVTGFSEFGIKMTGTPFIIEVNKCRITKNGVGIGLSGNAITISNCHIDSNSSGGILAAGGTVQNIINNTIESNSGYGIRFKGQAGNGGVSQVINIYGNYFENNKGDGDIELLGDNVNLGINLENNYFNGNANVKYGIYSLRSDRGRFINNLFNGGHALGVAHFSGYGAEKNTTNVWQHNNRHDNRFGDTHSLIINGWEKFTLQKTPENKWAVNGLIVADAKNTARFYQNIWILKEPWNCIGVIEALRFKTGIPFTGTSMAYAKAGTSKQPDYYMTKAYNLMSESTDNDSVYIFTADKINPSKNSEIFTVQITVGDGEDIANISSGSSLEFWIKRSGNPQ